MNERLLLEMAATLGHRLAMSGAETYRVEESIMYVLRTYGLEAECFAIPNCLFVSIITQEGKPMTRMLRIGSHGNDMDSVERYNDLSRRICAQRPEPETAMQWLEETDKSLRQYSPAGSALGYFLGSFGFALFFGGTLADGLCAGLCGLLLLIVDQYMEKIRSTQFFRVITGAFFSAALAYLLWRAGLCANPDAAIIGTLMILVPGLLFTNAMRDVMYGDTNSGLNRVVQVLLIAIAIALGTAAALRLTTHLWGDPMGTGLIDYGFWLENLVCFLGCIGFAILFNIHGVGVFICALGGMMAWSAYLIADWLGCGIFVANLAGAIVAALYSETMARVRRYPAISYLVVAIFPQLPGAGLYYTMSYAVHNDMLRFAEKGMETASVAGALAVGILLVSTAFRLWSKWLYQTRGKYGHH